MYKRVRQALDLSTEEMAALLGTNSATIQQWESGETTPEDKLKSLFADIDMRLRVYQRLRSTSEQLSLSTDLDHYLEDIKKALSGEAASLERVDDVVMEHLAFAIDDFLRKKDLAASDFPKAELARYLYDHIKFLL